MTAIFTLVGKKMAFVSVPKDLTKGKKKKKKSGLKFDKKAASLPFDCGGNGITVLFFNKRLDWDE